MVKTIRSKALKRLYEKGDASKIHADHRERVIDILALLDSAGGPHDLEVPGLKLDLHPLKGERRGTWAVTIKKNWRITFKFQGQHVMDVDYEDYH